MATLKMLIKQKWMNFWVFYRIRSPLITTSRLIFFLVN